MIFGFLPSEKCRSEEHGVGENQQRHQQELLLEKFR